MRRRCGRGVICVSSGVSPVTVRPGAFVDLEDHRGASPSTGRTTWRTKCGGASRGGPARSAPYEPPSTLGDATYGQAAPCKPGSRARVCVWGRHGLAAGDDSMLRCRLRAPSPKFKRVTGVVRTTRNQRCPSCRTHPKRAITMVKTKSKKPAAKKRGRARWPRRRRRQRRPRDALLVRARQFYIEGGGGQRVERRRNVLGGLRPTRARGSSQFKFPANGSTMPKTLNYTFCFVLTEEKE